MSTNIKYAQSDTSISPMEAGTYPAVCNAVVDLGVQKTEWEGKEKEQAKILLMWEFPTETIEYNGEIKLRQMSQTYTFSVNERAALRRDLISWRGRDFTADEVKDFDIARVLGAPCMITVSQTNRNGKTYANIAAVSKLMKGIEVPAASKKIHFDIDDETTYPAFAELPEWIQSKINDSVTFKQRDICLDKNGNIINPAVSLLSDVEEPHMEEISTEEDLPF